jgi:antagonist of KipI
MDRRSLQLANLLCGNPPGAAALEAAWHGAQWITESSMLVAFCGGANLYINERQVPSGRPILVPAFSVMALEPGPAGFYSYLAVAGGFQSQLHQGSASTYIPSQLGGMQGRALREGDLLETGLQITGLSQQMAQSLHAPGNTCALASWGFETEPDPSPMKIIRMTEGPEFNWLDESVGSALWSETFSISLQSNRMASRLVGRKILIREEKELLSTAVTRGTVQATHDGTLLVLMADAQTTGGYPRVAQVASADLPRFAQLRPGEKVRFDRISREQAEELYLAEETMLRNLERSIAMRYGL